MYLWINTNIQLGKFLVRTLSKMNNGRWEQAIYEYTHLFIYLPLLGQDRRIYKKQSGRQKGGSDSNSGH